MKRPRHIQRVTADLWKQIQVMREEGMSMPRIADALNLTKSVVMKAIKRNGPPIFATPEHRQMLRERARTFNTAEQREASRIRARTVLNHPDVIARRWMRPRDNTASGITRSENRREHLGLTIEQYAEYRALRRKRFDFNERLSLVTTGALPLAA